MTDDDSNSVSMFKEHEKFWAFVFLILAVLGLVFLASTFDKGTTATDLVMQAKLRIIDAAITGLLTITGMAAQALFRVSSVDRQNAVTFERALSKVPEAPAAAQPVQEVKVVNPPNDPANVTDAHSPPADDTAGLPESMR